MITRTFSKVYGLAGLRVGFAMASSEIADLLQRVRQPFNVNNLALAAAIGALDDHLFVAESFQLNQRGIEQIVAGLKRLGLDHIPTHGNFVTFRTADASGVNQRLLKQGVQLHAFPKDVMLAARKASSELYEEEARKNAVFRRIYVEWKKFAAASDQWFKVAESPYANFMYYVK